MFLFRLCLEQGVPHPDYLRDVLDARQIAQWMAYSQIEPFGAEHDEVLHAIRCAAILAPWRKDGVQIDPEDFMPSRGTRPQTWQEMRDNLLMWKAVTE